jgi:hypothetical protein
MVNYRGLAASSARGRSIHPSVELLSMPGAGI